MICRGTLKSNPTILRVGHSTTTGKLCPFSLLQTLVLHDFQHYFHTTVVSKNVLHHNVHSFHLQRLDTCFTYTDRYVSTSISGKEVTQVKIDLNKWPLTQVAMQ